MFYDVHSLFKSRPVTWSRLLIGCRARLLLSVHWRIFPSVMAWILGIFVRMLDIRSMHGLDRSQNSESIIVGMRLTSIRILDSSCLYDMSAQLLIDQFMNTE